jgi:hypothetical protein
LKYQLHDTRLHFCHFHYRTVCTSWNNSAVLRGPAILLRSGLFLQ